MLIIFKSSHPWKSASPSVPHAVLPSAAAWHQRTRCTSARGLWMSYGKPTGGPADVGKTMGKPWGKPPVLAENG